MSLYHDGNILFNKLGDAQEIKITFSDFTSIIIHSANYMLKFTSKSLLITDREKGLGEEYDIIKFYPWESIYSFQSTNNQKIIRMNQSEISNWLKEIKDCDFNMPYVNVDNNKITFIVAGQPRSVRSKGGKRSFMQKVEKIKEQIITPFKDNVVMHIDVFSKNISANNRPDIDRFSTLILDAFQGIGYLDDKQVIQLNPRIIDVSNAYEKLETRTHPMSPFMINNIPFFSMYPLAIGIEEYYVVRINNY